MAEINECAAGIIRDLREDPRTQDAFSMEEWEGNGVCGTVGCLAGTAILRSPLRDQFFVKTGSYERDGQVVEEWETRGYDWNGIVENAARMLGLPSEWMEPRELFIPRDWASARNYQVDDDRDWRGEENEFVTRLLYDNWGDLTAPVAARALEIALTEGVVDWWRAYQETAK